MSTRPRPLFFSGVQAREKSLLTVLGFCLLCLGCGSSQRRQSMVKADYVFINGDLYTNDEVSDVPPTALAVQGQRIVAVGTDSEIQSWVGTKTRIVNLKGHTLTPGLADAHAHLYGLGKSLESVPLRDVQTPEAAALLAGNAAAVLEPGEWVVGRGWDQNIWPEKVFPHYSVLDAVVDDRPVALRRIDGHALWVNHFALRLAGIDMDTPDPVGGKIVRDVDGRATGILIDMAMELVEGKIAPPTTATIKRRILSASKIASSFGLTSVHEMGIGDEVVAAYKSLADEGRLPLRVYAFLAGDLNTALTIKNRVPERDTDGSQYFVLRGIKLYADGALGSRGAVMLAPYSDDTENRGLWIMNAENLQKSAVAAAAAGWQVGVHAIGDAGNRAVLDAFEAAHKKYPDADLRFRVEHAQILTKEDIPRFVKLGVIASMQPTHATSDMPWAQDRVGAKRIAFAYAWRSLLKSGAHLASGSDFPVERVSPLLGLYSSVTRQNAKGLPAGGWLPSQRMTLIEAVGAFTKESAYASFSEENRGILKTGYLADLTVFDRKLAPDQSLLQTKIEMTFVGGELKYEQ